MPRKARVQKRGYYYHIIARGQRKNPLFFSYKDMNVFIKYLKECLAETDIELIAFCIMRNHYHLLVRKNKDDLDRLMHPLNTRYAIYFNKKYETVGRVFQGRYKSLPVLKEKHLYTIVNYINYNAVKHNIVKDINNYQFTSYHCYFNSSKKNKCLIDVQIPQFQTKKIYSIDVIFNEKKGYIGSETEYMAFEKRSEGRQNSRDRDKTSRQAVMQQLLADAMTANKIDLQYIKRNKYKKNNKDPINHVVIYLFEHGVTQSEIARLIGYSRAGIHKIIKNSMS